MKMVDAGDITMFGGSGVHANLMVTKCSYAAGSLWRGRGAKTTIGHVTPRRVTMNNVCRASSDLDAVRFHTAAERFNDSE